MIERRIQEAELVLPLPPSINSYYENARVKRSDIRGGDYTGRKVSKLVKKYRMGFSGCYIAQGRPEFGDELVVVEVYLHPKESNSTKKGDVDNFSKGLLDAASHAGLWTDDDQIVKLTTYKRKPIEGGAVILKVRLASQDEILKSQRSAIVGHNRKLWKDLLG